MKNLKPLKKASWLIGLSLSALVVVNCTTDESIDLEGGDLLENTSSSDLSSKSVEIGISGVTASAEQSANPAPNAIDNSSTSRWSSFGTGINLDLDLGSTANIDYIRIAFYKGNERRTSFKVFTSDNRNSWTQINSKTSSGNSTSLETFDLSNSSARYLRLECNGNTNSRWNSITDIQVWGSGGGPSDNGGGDDDTANGIIGNGWKLNGYTGSLRVSSNDNGLDYADDASTSESHFFFERNGYAAFRCYPGNPTSGGSSNPRSELREIIGNGREGYWNGNTNTEHSMKWKFRIEDLPPSGKLAFGQIHERNDSFDDVIRVQVQGSSGQNSGDVDLRILGYVTEEIEGSGRTVDFDMRMDTEYYFELAMRNGVVSLYDLNSNGTRSETLFRSVDIGNADENYFKAGCYLQSTSSSDDDSNTYGQVLIKDLTVNPDN